MTLAISRLRPQIEAAVRAGEPKKAVAMSLISELQIKEKELADLDVALTTATANVEQSLKARTAYEQKVRQQIQECQRQISRSKMAEVQSEMASLMGSFQVGDDSDTLQRITEQVDEKLARAEARQEVASTSVESQLADVQADAAAAQADDIYKQYQQSLGIVTNDTPPSEKTMASIPVPSTEPDKDIRWVETQRQ